MRRTSEMKIEIPEVNGGRCISENELECRIDPNTFAGAWLEHEPTTLWQKNILDVYQDAKAKGRLHAFTCMTIDASVVDGKLVYQKGLPIETGFYPMDWAEMLKAYNPSRNSRMMARIEYVCRNLYLIQKLVKAGCEIAKAYEMVCDDSREIGHYCNSSNHKNDFEQTGSREICGFYDLGNARKFIAVDPWEEEFFFLVAGGDYDCYSALNQVAYFKNYGVGNEDYYSVGMIALD